MVAKFLSVTPNLPKQLSCFFSLLSQQLWLLNLHTHFMGKDKGEVRKTHSIRNAVTAPTTVTMAAF